MKPFLFFISMILFTKISFCQKNVIDTIGGNCIGWKPTINGDISVCRPGNIQFTGSEPSGSWSSSNISVVGTIDQNGLFITGSRAGTTNIMYVAINMNGCRDTATKWITIFNKPDAGLITGDNKICRGGTIQFTTTGTGGTWSISNISAVGSIDQSGLFTTGTNAGTTKIRYIVTNANGCSDTAFKWITILNKPIAGNIAGNNTVCMGRKIKFTASRPGGTWSSSNISDVGTIDQNGIFSTGTRAGTTKIMYIMTNANGCSDTASMWITIFDSPSAGTISGDTVVCRGGTIQFTTTGTGGTWSISNISAVGSIDQSGLFTTGTNAGTTKIRYIVTNANGCSDTAFKWITIKNCAVNKIVKRQYPALIVMVESNKQTISIFPNPTISSFTVKSNSNEPGSLRVIDLSGKVLYNSKLLPNQSINFGEIFSPEIYWIEFLQLDKTTRIKAVKAR